MKIEDNKELRIQSTLTIKGLDEDDSLIVEGYANTTDKDRVGDVVLEEAWTKGGMVDYLKNPIILAYHKYDKPIGSMVEYTVNNKGLHIAAKISKASGDVYSLIKDGILKTFSIGFRVLDADYDSTTDIFVIKDLDLREISVVSIPANADSTFSVRKSFKDDQEYSLYKDKLITVEDTSTNIEVEDESSTKEKPIMVDKVKEGSITLTAEELAAKTKKAIDKAFADAKVKADAEEEAKRVAIEAGTTGAERLMAEFEKRMEVKDAEMSTALEGLRTDLAEKSEELVAMQKSKMSFGNEDSRKLTDLEMDTAYLVSRIINKDVKDTDYYKSNIIEKLGDHLDNANYEMIYSTRMYDAIQDKLVLEPMFASNKITMTSRSMTFPFNPQAGYANWVADTAYKSALTEADQAAVDAQNSSSAGDTRNHQITTIDLKAEKLASKEAIGYEEEEDSIIPILPIVREAIAKRMARTTDTELLRANATVETITGITGAALINGVATLASDDSCEHVQDGTFGGSNPITIADLQSTRRQMGSYGLNPSDVTYVVCESAYWDLIEDPDFRTMDLVGSQATILRGQVGSVNGSPVVVSDSFETPAAGTYAAIAINTSNYLFGELRGVNTERTKDVLNQKNWLVTTRRFAFNEIDRNGTAILNSCAVLKYGA